MAKPRPRQLVIDTDVTGAAADTIGVALSCAEFLEAVRRNGHRFVLTDDLLEEWNRHRSAFSARWLLRMVAAKKFDLVSVNANESLRAALGRAAPDVKAAGAMLKDAPLIEAALATEQRVVSRDNECRRCLRAAASVVALLRNLCWVNPTADDEQPLDWLAAGAPAERHRCLGHAAS